MDHLSCLDWYFVFTVAQDRKCEDNGWPNSDHEVWAQGTIRSPKDPWDLEPHHRANWNVQLHRVEP